MDGDDLSSGPAAPAVLDEPDTLVEEAPEGSFGEGWRAYEDLDDEELIPWWWPMTSYPGDEIARLWARRVFSFLIVVGCCGFVLWVCQPNLILRNTTPTGGDMGAHVWGPAYLRDQLLPHFRLSGWTPDWLAGFPAYTFYMVLPSLAIVILNVGLLPPWAAPITLLLFAGLAFYAHRRLNGRLVRFLAFSGCALAFLLSFHVPYNIAFKAVTVSGLILFPAAIWYLGKGLALRSPVPELMAIASLPFLMDKTLFSIFGGNIASTMAGEFAFSISLTAGIFFLGVAARGMATGRYRAWGAGLFAVTMLCHVIPSIYVAVGVLILLAMRIRWIDATRSVFRRVRGAEDVVPDDVDQPPGVDGDALEAEVVATDELATEVPQRSFVKRAWARLPVSVRWLVPVGATGGLIASFWYLPFYGLSAYLDDMGWCKYGLVSSAAGQTKSSLTEYLGWLLPFAPHKPTLQGAVTAADPDMLHGRVIFVLAGIGVILSLAFAVRAGIFFTLFGIAGGLGFWLMPQDRFWNARILPLYYLCVYMLAAIGVWLVVRLVPRLLDADWGHPPRWAGAVMVGLAAVGGFWLMNKNAEWNAGAHVLGYFCVFALAAAGVFLLTRQTPEVDWGHPLVWMGLIVMLASVVVGLGLMPHAHEWSVERQFGFYLAEFASIGLGTVLLVRFIARSPSPHPRPWVGVSVIGTAALVVLAMMLISIREVPWFSSVTTDAKGVTTYNVGPFHTTYQGPVLGWVQWNFTGLELACIGSSPAAGCKSHATELTGIRRTMTEIGRQDGCRHAYWEYSDDLNNFGSPMTLMLLPYWTKSCIGSMEGLYMESSSTTPFHFTVQGELSDKCSSAQRWDIFGVDPATVYKGVQFDLGIRHLQMLGVRYFMASSDTIKADAAKDPRLKKLATTGAFDVYQVRDAPLVEGLDTLPAVWTDVTNPIHSWAKPAEKWFTNPKKWGVYRAADGPSNWPRVSSHKTPKTVHVDPAKVSNIIATRDSISFDVDHVGTPVLVKSSYFPDWQTQDGAGPYRVTPNLMVVVPTSKHVVLTYGRSKIELLGWAFTLIGIAFLLWMVRRGDPDSGADDPYEFEGDRESPTIPDLDEEPEPTFDESGLDPDPEIDEPTDPEPERSDPIQQPELVGAGPPEGFASG